MRLLWLAAVCGGLAFSVSGALAADRPEKPAAPALTEREAHALAGTFRALLVEHAPRVLYEASPGWGHTARVARGVKWTGKHLPLHPETVYKDRNDGTWRRVRVTAENLADTLVFDLRNVRNPQPGRMTFDAFVSFDAVVDYEQQDWDAGRRVYAGSVRARLRVKLLLGCEVVTKLQDTGALLPDATFRLRVTRADLRYDNFKAEHVAGVGGEAAKVLGDAVQGSLRAWRPSLEKELLARADAAIVRAGDTKEVRVRLADLFNKDRLTAPALRLLPGPKS